VNIVQPTISISKYLKNLPVQMQPNHLVEKGSTSKLKVYKDSIFDNNSSLTLARKIETTSEIYNCLHNQYVIKQYSILSCKWLESTKILEVHGQSYQSSNSLALIVPGFWSGSLCNLLTLPIC
jgi:hypothetical protein